MDIATISGLLLGAVILVTALVLGNVPFLMLFKPEAFLIVFGGTFTAVLINFSMPAIVKALQSLKQCFVHPKSSLDEDVYEITTIAHFVRKEGILPLQYLIPQIADPFLRKGLTLLTDNRPEQYIRESLGTELEIAYREDVDNARVFEAAGGFSPTMGIIGAVVGLIHVVQTFNDPVELGQGVAGAFSATFYGVAIANLFFLPLAGKLRQRARDAWFQKTLLLEGLMSIYRGEHPTFLEEKLQLFLSNTGKQDLMRNPNLAPHAGQEGNPLFNLPDAILSPPNKSPIPTASLELVNSQSKY